MRRGFSLAEILTGLLLMSSVVLMAAAGGRWFMLSVTRISRWLMARERSQRVISFVEPRILHAGLGMSKWRGAVSRAFGDSSNVPVIAGWPDSNRCITIYDDEYGILTPTESENGVFSGAAFSVIYARPSGIIISVRQGNSLSLAKGSAAAFDIIAGSWAESGFIVSRPRNLLSWGLLPLAGTPLLITARSGTRLTLSLTAQLIGSIEISKVNELFFVCCERFCVRNGVFRFQGMEDNWTPAAFYPREDGVLAMWFEWRPADRLFDMWVLASGGPSVYGISARPAEWPDDAPWQDEFSAHELCVSRASWRLENV